MQIMNSTRKTLAAALLAACCATSFAAQSEAPPPDGAQRPDAGQRPDGSGGRGPHAGFEHHGQRGQRGQGGHGSHGGPGFGGFRDLGLSEAQQDKLFAIEHAAAPQRRQQDKALRHAHEALRALRDAAQFDEAKAGAAARELGQAVAAEALLEARLHAKVLAVLSPEQREQLRQRHN
jgi:Spy/CpxP family protein refolding chaperone